MGRIDKLAKLIAVFDEFHDAMRVLEAPLAKRLAEGWVSARSEYVTPKGASRSASSAGMEQALREMPMVLESMRLEDKRYAAKALAAAIKAHYPEFLDNERDRLVKIMSRGFIRSESEYYVIRYHIDSLEGEPGLKEELVRCYELIEQFEARDT